MDLLPSLLVPAIGGNAAQTGLFYDTGAAVANVKASPFGARGDGVTDDTAAIQAAINTGNPVLLPRGTYQITAPLVLNRQTEIVGEGGAATLIRGGNFDTFQLNVTGVVNVGARVFNYLLQGFALLWTSDQASGNYGIHVGNVGNLTLRDVQIAKSGGGKPYLGLYIEDSSNCFVYNTTITNCQSHGVQYAPLAGGDIVEWYWADGCIINGNGGDGFHIGSDTTGTTEGIHIGMVSCYNNGGYAVQCQGTSTGIVKNIDLVRTILDSSVKGGFKATTTNANKVHDITLADVWCSFNSNPAVTGAVTDYGCNIDVGVVNVTINGGNYLLAGQDGIRIAGQQVNVTGVQCYNNGQGAGAAGLSTYYGIRLENSASDYLVSSNLLYNDTIIRADTYAQNGIFIGSSAGVGYVGGNHLFGLGTVVPDSQKLNYSTSTKSPNWRLGPNFWVTGATKIPPTTGGLRVLMPDGANSDDAFSLDSPTTNAHTAFRINGTTLQILNSSFALMASLTSGGLFTAPGGLTVAGGPLISGTFADTYSATIALDVTKASQHTLAASATTAAASTINASAAGAAGQQLTILTAADASGTVTVTFGTNLHASGTQATAASHFSSITFESDGTRWVEKSRTTSLA